MILFRDFGRDLLRSVRSLTRTPGFACGVIGSLTLGIVANTAAFSFINAAVFRPAAGRGSYAVGVDVTIVGVVGPVAGERADGIPVLYFPAPLMHMPARSLLVRFDQSGQFSAGALENAVREVDYRVPIGAALTLRERRDGTNQEQRLVARGVVALGVFALTLATGGLYNVVSYLVARRRREIGIRLALGATRASVVGLILRQALTPTLLGAVFGAGGAVAVGLIVRSRLYGAAPIDPLAFAAAAAVLATATVIASVAPARDAASVDPVEVLRAE
jgi:putative ABC transport system permease protein